MKSFTDPEIDAIVQGAHALDLNHVMCPRSGCGGRVLPQDYEHFDISDDEEARGARFNHHDDGIGLGRRDVSTAAVVCDQCGYAASGVDFMRREDQPSDDPNEAL